MTYVQQLVLLARLEAVDAEHEARVRAREGVHAGAQLADHLHLPLDARDQTLLTLVTRLDALDAPLRRHDDVTRAT